MLKIGLPCFQNLAVFFPKSFLKMFDYFPRCMKGLIRKMKVKLNWKQANLHKLHNSSICFTKSFRILIGFHFLILASNYNKVSLGKIPVWQHKNILVSSIFSITSLLKEYISKVTIKCIQKKIKRISALIKSYHYYVCKRKYLHKKYKEFRLMTKEEIASKIEIWCKMSGKSCRILRFFKK